MRIREVLALPAAVPLSNPFEISLDRIKLKRHVVVRIQTDTEIEGYGEVGVLPAEIGGPMEAIIDTINGYLAPTIVGMDPFDVALIHRRMDTAVDGFNFAKAPVDIALYDIMGKALQVPVHKLLGGRYRDKIELTWVVGIDTATKNAEEARRNVGKGFGCIKVKVGKDSRYDVHRVKAIREAVGNDIPIRLDVNQGYSPKEAIATLTQLEPVNLQCVEQPVRKGDLRGLAEVAHNVSVPIMTDEAISEPEDLMRVIELGAASIINIKLARVGGLYRGKNIAAIAESAGLTCILGCMLELGVGIAAAAHLAAALPNVEYQSDLIGHLYHEEDIIVDSERALTVKDGTLSVPAGQGLGVAVNAEALTRYEAHRSQ